MRPHFIGLLFFSLFSLHLGAQDTYMTPNTGINWTLEDLLINSDGILTKLDFEYLQFGEIIIAPNDTISIEQEASIYCSEQSKWTIQGVLLASSEAQLTFDRMDENTPFEGFRFEGGNKSTLYNTHFFHCKDISLVGSNLSLQNCLFSENGDPQELGFLNVFQAVLEVIDCIFENNEGAAIMSAANSDSKISIVNSSFLHNNIGNSSNVPQLNFGTTGVNDTIKVINCNITGISDISGGIAISTLAGGNLNAIIKNNIIQENRYGIAVYGNNIHANISNNQLINNNIQNIPMQGGSGITVYANSSTTTKIYGNTISGNLWGITILNAPTLFMGSEEIHGNNSILDNGNEDHIYNLYNNTANDYEAKYNYWGSTETEEIEEGIFHQNDDSSLGLITFEPFLLDFPLSSSETASPKKEAGFYPNPVENNIYFTNPDIIQHLYIYSLDGKMILTKQKISKSLSLSKLDSGTYILKLVRNNDTTFFKLIKK